MHGQGIKYYPDYRYSIPSTRDVIDAMGKTVSDDFKAGYYKAIQLYVE